MKTEKDRLQELGNRDLQDARTNAQSVPQTFYRLTRLEEELGRWFLQASKNEISPKELKRRTDLLRDCYAHHDEFSDISDLLLDDCIASVDELHDYPGMESFDKGWLSYFKKLSLVLMGESEKQYYYRPCPGVSLRVTYEKKDL